MIPYMRRQQLLEYIKEQDTAYFKDLEKNFSVSSSTLRRDLIELENQGHISLLRGGAILYIKTEENDEPVTKKKFIHTVHKSLIAKKAASYVEDGDIIYIDSGTTTSAMFPFLRNKDINIVTSSIPNLEELKKGKHKVLFLGGEVLPTLESVVGTLTEKILSSMYFTKSFIGASAYNDDGIFTYDIREAHKKDLVRSHSDQVFVLADTSKEGKTAFVKAFDLNEIILITENSK